MICANGRNQLIHMYARTQMYEPEYCRILAYKTYRLNQFDHLGHNFDIFVLHSLYLSTYRFVVFVNTILLGDTYHFGQYLLIISNIILGSGCVCAG